MVWVSNSVIPHILRNMKIDTLCLWLILTINVVKQESIEYLKHCIYLFLINIYLFLYTFLLTAIFFPSLSLGLQGLYPLPLRSSPLLLRNYLEVLGNLPPHSFVSLCLVLLHTHFLARILALIPWCIQWCIPWIFRDYGLDGNPADDARDWVSNPALEVGTLVLRQN